MGKRLHAKPLSVKTSSIAPAARSARGLPGRRTTPIANAPMRTPNGGMNIPHNREAGAPTADSSLIAWWSAE
jgi:hypothetical protein